MTNPSFAHIFESLPLGVVVFDLSGCIQFMNRSARAMLHVREVCPGGRNLHTLPGLLSLSELLRPDSVKEAEETTIQFEGRTLEITAAAVEEEGPPVRVMTLKDVTQREKSRAIEKSKERYALVSELSADIAHEIRNPLGSIELLASLLRKESLRGKDVHRANQIMAAVKNVESAISGLIHRNKKDQLPAIPVKIHDLLREILLFSETIIDGGSVFLSARYAEGEPIIACSAEMMKQVFLHIILNALPGVGCLDIVTQWAEESQAIEIHFVERSEADPRNGQFGIFNRLSRAKDDHWGLGLAIIHNIVDLYRGCMRFEYREEVGAALVLSFPVLGTGKPVSDASGGAAEARKEADEEE
ncbi:MAG: hypothetical protein LLG97_12065 [Deltaproteobacteria bacterium]|nr:hypothetical protein [Deltaproteobacteria bacterium]